MRLWRTSRRPALPRRAASYRPAVVARWAMLRASGALPPEGPPKLPGGPSGPEGPNGPNGPNGPEGAPKPPGGPPLSPAAILELASLYPVLRRTVRAIHGDRNDVDDLTQEAALRVYVLWHRYDLDMRPSRGKRDRRSWAAVVALHVVQEYRQRSRMKKRAGEVLAGLDHRMDQPDSLDLEALVMNAETLRELESATTPRRWRAFYLQYVEEYTRREVAERMNVSKSTAQSWILSAASDIRAYLARRDRKERRK